MIDLTGKTALVTGSSRGIGAGIAKVLGQAGASVVINCRKMNEEALETERIIKQYGGKTMICAGDVTNEDDVKKIISDIIKEFGRIDILINNAGISGTTDIITSTLEDWERIMNANLTSAFLCTKHVIPHMQQQQWGRILMTSSVVVRQGALFGHFHYCASKSGMVGMAKTIARTVAKDNITVNSLGVGSIATSLFDKTIDNEKQQQALSRIPLGRFGTPEEVGHLCAFLASDLAGYITGTLIDINGGMVMDG